MDAPTNMLTGEGLDSPSDREAKGTPPIRSWQEPS